MKILILTVKLYAPWVHSLKEKRSEVKRLLAALRNKYNISTIEAGTQDAHQTITLGICAAAASAAQADSIAENVLRLMEQSSQAQIMDVEKEIL